MKHNSILLIMAQEGFLYKGSQQEGYTALHPYKPCNIFIRILREIVFRFFPFASDYFYTKDVFNGCWTEILVWDPLITIRFLNKLHKTYPYANIHFIYWNMVGKATHLLPEQLPSFVDKWTYDAYDSEKYKLKLYSSYPYFKCFIKPHLNNLYDVLFVGRDKGRGDFLLDLEKRLNDKGVKTKFIITKSERFSRQKKYYAQEVSYDVLCDLISHSKAVLNVVMDNQMGLTLRDLEYVFQNVKLITTNVSIVDDPIFREENVYVIKGGIIDGINEFLKIPMSKLPKEVIEHHTFDSFVHEIICNNNGQ